eukprot:GHRR01005200.1.p1 GENE.GHRR01005200.1~~GHRR01005200.1.p1  ORF type:complete len:343 (+),score=79.96 GHRR01005200.1:167-1195(+)
MIPPLSRQQKGLARASTGTAPAAVSRPCLGAVPKVQRTQQRARQHLPAEQGPFGLQKQRMPSHICRATIDEPEIQELVQKLIAMTPDPPAERLKLEKVFALIDTANSQDPTRISVNGEQLPYRLAYSKWLTGWVLKLDSKASDELLILARGRNIESWKLADIKRDDYAPNTPGQRQWEMDRKRWLAQRLLEVVKEAGYDTSSQLLIEDVMMGRNIPDPRDTRKYDLIGVFGMINYRTLQAVCMIQALDDAEALLFLEKNFTEMFNRMPAEEVAAVCKRELSRLSQNGIVTVLKQKWTPVQQRLLQKVLPVPFKFNDIMMDVEGVAAASTHPGDWRYRNFDYE